MVTYNEESLEQLNKKNLVTIILSLQTKLETVNEKLVEEFKQLKERIEADVSVTKKVNRSSCYESYRFGTTVLGKCPIFKT